MKTDEQNPDEELAHEFCVPGQEREACWRALYTAKEARA